LKRLLLLLLTPLISFAYIHNAEREICTQLLSAIFQNKKVIKVYSTCPEISQNNTTDSKIILVDTPKKADLIITNKYIDIQSNKPIFVRKYYLLKKYKKRAIGGFYWQKGRPNIIFEGKNLKKFNIILPDNFQRFIEYAPEE